MSKIDCSITENYLKEKARMTNSKGFLMCQISCNKCPLNYSNNENKMSCYLLQNTLPSEAIAIVQAWSDEHPVKTIKDDFLEKYPNAEYSQCDGALKVCAKWLGYFNKDYSCPDKGDCNLCWNTPLSEVQK